MEYRHIQYFYETWNIEILYHEIYEYRHINYTNNIGTIYIYGTKEYRNSNDI